MKVLDLTLSTKVFIVKYLEIKERYVTSIVTNNKDLFNGSIGSVKLNGKERYYFRTFEDTNLFNEDNEDKCFFSNEDAVKGLIEILEKKVKSEEEDVSWKTQFIKDSNKRLYYLKELNKDLIRVIINEDGTADEIKDLYEPIERFRKFQINKEWSDKNLESETNKIKDAIIIELHTSTDVIGKVQIV